MLQNVHTNVLRTLEIQSLNKNTKGPKTRILFLFLFLFPFLHLFDFYLFFILFPGGTALILYAFNNSIPIHFTLLKLFII